MNWNCEIVSRLKKVIVSIYKICFGRHVVTPPPLSPCDFHAFRTWVWVRWTQEEFTLDLSTTKDTNYQFIPIRCKRCERQCEDALLRPIEFFFIQIAQWSIWFSRKDTSRFSYVREKPAWRIRRMNHAFQNNRFFPSLVLNLDRRTH